MTESIDVVVRCRNEMPWTPRALDALLSQRGVAPRIVGFECRSDDGSAACFESREISVYDVDPKRYVPGVVLNRGMRATSSAIVAFVNADAIALDPHALERLIAPFADADVAATFGRQVARESARAVTQADYSRAFGDRAVTVRRGAFFSMAASAIRRTVWEKLPFDEELRYSEDVDWTTRVAHLGHSVVYVPDARFEHSHDYDAPASFKRRRGEGRADRVIHRLGAPSVVFDLVKPLVGALLRDARSGLLLTSSPIRVAEAVGYFVGRRD